MSSIRLGISQEALGLPVRAALDAVAKVGVRGIQLDAIRELNPTTLGDTARRELRVLIRNANLEATALNCPIRRGLDTTEDLQQRLEHLVAVMQLAADLGPRKILLPLPELPKPDDASTPRAETLHESLTSLGRAADRLGVVVALEAGFDSAEVVLTYLAGFDSGSLMVNFDPVNFLAHGQKPIAALGALGGRLAHVQARDAHGRNLSGGPKETAIGQGDLDWLTVFAVLDSLEYRGFVVVDREQGSDRRADALAGAEFLKRFVPPTVG